MLKLWERSYKDQEKEIRKKVWPVITTETLLRKWERRLIVALTSDEENKCKYYIDLYS